MAYMQIGDNLYADEQGKYYNLNNGNYANVTSPFDAQQQKINDIYNAQRKNQLDALRAQRDRAIKGFNKQKADLRPQFQNQRNQADVVNAQNTTRLRELMAANGINASGENLTTQANLMSARQNALGEINTQENQAMGEIDRQIAAENDPSREDAINNAVELDRSKALADLNERARQEIYERYLDWRNYQMQLQERQRAEAAARARSSRRTTSSKKSTTSSNAKTTLSAATKSSTAQTNLQRYYSPPIPFNQRYLYDEYNLAKPTVANNPNLTAWEKMKMIGG